MCEKVEYGSAVRKVEVWAPLTLENYTHDEQLLYVVAPQIRHISVCLNCAC